MPSLSVARPYKLPVTYTIYKTGTLYYVMDTDGKFPFTPSASLSTLLGQMKTAKPNGFHLHIKDNTTLVWDANVDLALGSATTKNVIVSGEGWNSGISNAVVNNCIFTVSNATKLDLFDLKISTSNASASPAIKSVKTGADATGLFRSKWDNVLFEGGADGQYMVDLTNPFKNEWGYVLFLLNNGLGLRWLNDSAAIHYGNNSVETLAISTTGTDAFHIESATDTHNMNLNHVKTFYGFQNGAVGTTQGLTFGVGSKYNKFDYVDIEGFKYGVHFEGNAASYATQDIISGGYINGTDLAVFFDAHSTCCKIKDVELDATGSAWQDNGDFNIVEDTDWSSAIGISTHTSTDVRGHAGNAKFYNKWLATQTGTGGQQTIAHGLIATPSAKKILLCEATTGLAVPYQSAAADATNIYVTATNAKTYNVYVSV